MNDILGRHSKICLSFSGGKDSLACVYMLRPYLDRITIYHNDTGDLLPEVMEIVEHVKEMAPHFVHLRGDVAAWIEANGVPSDLVPYTAHPVARAVGQEVARIVSRYDCCYANLMLPLWERIVADGNTLVIRGTKTVDFPTLPVRDGETAEGIEFWHPLEGWSHAQVFDYLREQGAPICRVYEDSEQAPECAGCPAWLNVGQAAYLKKHHPQRLEVYRERMRTVLAGLDPSLIALAREVKELGL